MEFVGKLHPVFVHLPIGILLIAVVFIWLNESEKVIRISVGLGSLFAIVSVITGLLLENSGGYNEDTVEWHEWMGIGTAAVSVTMFFVEERKILSIITVLFLVITGHLGGTITHGSLIDEEEPANLDISAIDMNQAAFYNDAVKPVLEARCYSCHGETKQKGGLRLDSKELIMKGGKNGKIIAAGNMRAGMQDPGESDLVRRIMLPDDHEDHMPPKEKKQLTDQEKKLIALWVESGSDFDKKIAEVLNEKQIASISEDKPKSTGLPDTDVPAPDQQLITKLVEQGVAITPVSKESNFLQANFISVPDDAGRLLKEMKPVAKNVVWLKLNGATINQIDLSDLVNLTELNLSGTLLDDSALDQIIKCKDLAKLNISGTKITAIKKLEALKKLRYLNIYNTSIKDADLPGVEIERGSYEVPTLGSDTTELKQ